MQVKYDPIEDATEQFKIEQTQRIFASFRTFTPPLKERMPRLSQRNEFDLAFKVSYDPVSIAGVGFVAGLRQAVDSPNYPQGAKDLGAVWRNGG